MNTMPRQSASLIVVSNRLQSFDSHTCCVAPLECLVAPQPVQSCSGAALPPGLEVWRYSTEMPRNSLKIYQNPLVGCNPQFRNCWFILYTAGLYFTIYIPDKSNVS